MLVPLRRCCDARRRMLLACAGSPNVTPAACTKHACRCRAVWPRQTIAPHAVFAGWGAVYQFIDLDYDADGFKASGHGSGVHLHACPPNTVAYLLRPALRLSQGTAY